MRNSRRSDAYLDEVLESDFSHFLIKEKRRKNREKKFTKKKTRDDYGPIFKDDEY